MTETDWSAELAIACAACGAPAGSPCRTVRGHPVEYMHIDRVADVAEVEVREDAAGTDSLIEAVTRKLDGDDVPLRGEEWRAVIDSPYSLILWQWADSAERDEPTGPSVRVTFTVHIEEQPRS